MEDSSGGGGGPERKCTTTALFFGRTGLFLLMTGYALFGALLFKSLEEGEIGDVRVHVQRTREDCLRELWLITERLNVLYEKNWTRLVTEQLKRFERAVVEAGKPDGNAEIAPRWTFGGALLYSVTLLTTVGYGNLSPRTSLGKIAAVIYALIGVPLMLILLSALGATLASGARKAYTKLTCQRDSYVIRSPTVGYHKAPSSPGSKYDCISGSVEDSASIQMTSENSTPNHHHHICPSARLKEYQEIMPKKAVLATVRATHARGRCMSRQFNHRQSWSGDNCDDEIEENDEDDAEENCGYLRAGSHDTPSRVPLIWRRQSGDSSPPPPTTSSPSPTVPASLVLVLFFAYVCLGAAAFVSSSGWSVLDATYFCFIALSTIGIGDKLPQSDDAQTQIQLFACCVYLFLGLVLVATCFSLVQEDIANKCRHIANNVRFVRN